MPSHVVTSARVRDLLTKGLTVTEIAHSLGLSKSTVCYHKRRLGYRIETKFNRRYDWAEIQRYYDRGHSISDCERRFGFARGTFLDAVKRGAVMSRPQGAPVDVYLVAGRRVNRSHLKGRLLSAGLKHNRCEECGISTWRSKPLSMALHHVNGDRHDNRLENLQLLCPNCHSQTPNFSGRNKRSLTRLPPELVAIGADPVDRRTWRRLPVLGVAV